MTTFHTAQVEGLNVFYRQAGTPGAPKLLLLGGFPSSSHQFRNLIPALADRFHVVSVDYPGFGNTDLPDPATWDYTFDHLTDIVEGLLEQIGFTGPMGLYMQDYGGPIGNRIIARHPDWLQWQVIQNANTYEEGFTEVWDGIRHALWVDRSPETEAPLEAFLKPDTVKAIYTTGHPRTEDISPDNWNMDMFFMSRPGNDRIQLELFYSYGTNPPLYPKWQAYFREYQPPTLIVWGKNDKIFPAEGAYPYKRDLNDVDFHLLDTGHFALEEDGAVIADHIRRFITAKVSPETETSRAEAK